MSNNIQSLEEMIFSNCYSGTDFENRILGFLTKLGFKANKTGNNDGGVDIIARIHIQDIDYCFFIQCKFYNKPLGKGPIQEVFTGAHYYDNAGTPVVVTNNHITPEARMYAKKLGVQIIADLEWEEMNSVYLTKKITNPVQYTGLVGMIIGYFAKDISYFQASVSKKDIDKSSKEDDIGRLKAEITSEFDEAEECIREAAYLQQQSAKYQARALQIQKRIVLANLDFG